MPLHAPQREVSSPAVIPNRPLYWGVGLGTAPPVPAGCPVGFAAGCLSWGWGPELCSAEVVGREEPRVGSVVNNPDCTPGLPAAPSISLGALSKIRGVGRFLVVPQTRTESLVSG